MNTTTDTQASQVRFVELDETCKTCGQHEYDCFAGDEKVGSVHCVGATYSTLQPQEIIAALKAKGDELRKQHNVVADAAEAERKSWGRFRWANDNGEWVVLQENSTKDATGREVVVRKKNGDKKTVKLLERGNDLYGKPSYRVGGGNKASRWGHCSGCGEQANLSGPRDECDECRAAYQNYHAWY